jgi:hypothetical protein
MMFFPENLIMSNEEEQTAPAVAEEAEEPAGTCTTVLL